MQAKAQALGIRAVDVTVAPNAQDLADLVALAARGQLRVAIEQTLPLSEVTKAHKLIETGRVKRKIVLVP